MLPKMERLALKIYKFVEKKYEEYDKQEQRDTGEEFTNEIFEKAQKYFKIKSLKQLKILYSKGCYLSVVQMYNDKNKKNK